MGKRKYKTKEEFTKEAVKELLGNYINDEVMKETITDDLIHKFNITLKFPKW